jgi:hypothetical protein
MSLLVVILILLFWFGLDIKEKLTPSKPPIKDMENHLRMVMQADPKDRKKLIKKL